MVNLGLKRMTNTPASNRQAHTVRATNPLQGRVRIPGDKSISHRALILGAMAVGTTRIVGLLESDDVLATAAAMQALGCAVEKNADGDWRVRGRGVGGFIPPAQPLDFGNSGTGARLVMGAVTTSAGAFDFTGDASLSNRPMGRITEPLALMGAQVTSESATQANASARLPLCIASNGAPIPMVYAPEMASAQVKSAIMLAGLGAAGETTIIEATATRDHTENMIRLFGGQVDVQTDDTETRITVAGEVELTATDITVPGDPSSAAFPMVAALITPGSDIVLENIMLNPHRDGLIHVLRDMGGQIEELNPRTQAGERIADLRVRASQLRGIDVAASRAASMIDEYPALAVAAACATGRAHFAGLAELRVKESDRLAAIAAGLRANGVAVTEHADSLDIMGGPIAGGGRVATHHDHRIAMSFLVLGLAADAPVTVDDTSMIATSFPEFFDLMGTLGMPISHSPAAASSGGGV